MASAVGPERLLVTPTGNHPLEGGIGVHVFHPVSQQVKKDKKKADNDGNIPDVYQFVSGQCTQLPAIAPQRGAICLGRLHTLLPDPVVQLVA